MNKYVSEYSHYKYFIPTLTSSKKERKCTRFLCIWDCGLAVGNATGGPCSSPQMESAPGHLNLIFCSWVWRPT